MQAGMKTTLFQNLCKLLLKKKHGSCIFFYIACEFCLKMAAHFFWPELGSLVPLLFPLLGSQPRIIYYSLCDPVPRLRNFLQKRLIFGKFKMFPIRQNT